MPFRVCFCVQSSVLFCIFHSLSVICFTEPFLVSVSYFSFSLVFCVALFLIFCLVYWINALPSIWTLFASAWTIACVPGFTPLVKPSGYCSPIEDHACLLEYSSALPSIYLLASCSTLPVFLTMPINKSLHMDPHASHLVGPVTPFFLSFFLSSSLNTVFPLGLSLQLLRCKSVISMRVKLT